MNSIDRRIQAYQVQHDARVREKCVALRQETYTRLEEMLGREAVNDLKPTFTDDPGVWVHIPRRWRWPLEVFVTHTKHGLELRKGWAYAEVETAEDFWLQIGKWK